MLKEQVEHRRDVVSEGPVHGELGHDGFGSRDGASGSTGRHRAGDDVRRSAGAVITQRHIEDCLNALIDEGRALQRLLTLLERQRHALMTDDPVMVDQTAAGMSRVLLTTAEARHRRQSLLALMGRPTNSGLSAFESVFGEPLPGALASARRSLLETAAAVQREAATNDRLIRRARRAGYTRLHRLFGRFLGTSRPRIEVSQDPVIEHVDTSGDRSSQVSVPTTIRPGRYGTAAQIVTVVRETAHELLITA